MYSESLELDHIAINVKDNMDKAYQLFTELGFILTPRGYHSLGSINHSMVFNDNYLELIGNQKGKPINRPELKNAALGINGLVFKTNSVKRIYNHLVNINFEQDAPRTFNRPVFIDDIEHKAMFETVSLNANIFKAGRVYYCNHLTPNLVWIPKYMEHFNTSLGIEEIIIIDDEPKSISDKFTKICKKLKIKTSNNQITLKTKD
ncbi:VOC family protein, partial [Alphaproteobacteria bacterium]|nr:VOC family protein [Alphaproteobacteria bacterium]